MLKNCPSLDTHKHTIHTHPLPQWIVGPFTQPLGVLETPIGPSGVSHTWLPPLSHINTLSTHPDTLCQWKVPSTPDFPWTILTWGHQREAVMDTLPAIRVAAGVGEQKKRGFFLVISLSHPIIYEQLL